MKQVSTLLIALLCFSLFAQSDIRSGNREIDSLVNTLFHPKCNPLDYYYILKEIAELDPLLSEKTIVDICKDYDKPFAKDALTVLNEYYPSFPLEGFSLKRILNTSFDDPLLDSLVLDILLHDEKETPHRRIVQLLMLKNANRFNALWALCDGQIKGTYAPSYHEQNYLPLFLLRNVGTASVVERLATTVFDTSFGNHEVDSLALEIALGTTFPHGAKVLSEKMKGAGDPGIDAMKQIFRRYKKQFWASGIIETMATLASPEVSDFVVSESKKGTLLSIVSKEPNNLLPALIKEYKEKKENSKLIISSISVEKLTPKNRETWKEFLYYVIDANYVGFDAENAVKCLIRHYDNFDAQQFLVKRNASGYEAGFRSVVHEHLLKTGTKKDLPYFLSHLQKRHPDDAVVPSSMLAVQKWGSPKLVEQTLYQSLLTGKNRSVQHSSLLYIQAKSSRIKKRLQYHCQQNSSQEIRFLSALKLLEYSSVDKERYIRPLLHEKVQIKSSPMLYIVSSIIFTPIAGIPMSIAAEGDDRKRLLLLQEQLRERYAQ